MDQPTRIVDHGYRGRASGMHGQFWTDWQANEGAWMDAPPDYWTPAGSTKGETLMRGTAHAYTFRTGHTWAGATAAARRDAFPVVDGVAYHVTFWRGGLEEARAMRPRARPLRQWSKLWHKVTHAGAHWFPDGLYTDHTIGR